MKTTVEHLVGLLFMVKGILEVTTYDFSQMISSTTITIV
jgi:hypothetical protein